MIKTLCRILSLTGILVSVTFNYCYSQDITHHATVDSYLSSLFAQSILNDTPTGYLLDRAFEAANVLDFSGSALTDSNYADVNVFRNILLTMNSARVNANATTYNVNSLVNSLADTVTISIGLAVFQYNFIVGNALSDSMIEWQNGVIDYAYTNPAPNIFASAFCFAFTPSLSVYSGQDITYKVCPNHILGNCSISQIEFDSGSGIYNQVSQNTSIPVHYSTPGDKHLRMKVTLAGGVSLESHAIIRIKSEPSYAPSSTLIDGMKQFPTGATVTWKYSSGRSSIVKPFIYVEGFDDALLGYLGDFAEEGRGQLLIDIIERVARIKTGSNDFYSFYDTDLNGCSFIKDNYDIVYVDWWNPEADITENARILDSIIVWVNNKKHESLSTERNVVVGHSMGGLIANYALRDLELSGIPHETDCFVSYDAPHMGVNVPIGLQYAARDAYWLLYGDSGDQGIIDVHLADGFIDYFISALDSPSAKQMMYYYVDSDAVINNNFHNSWLSLYLNHGFPIGDPGSPIENLSIVNGGLHSNYSNDLLDADFVISDHSPSWWKTAFRFFTSIPNIKTHFDVDRNMGNGGRVSNATASYKKKFLWWSTNNVIDLFGSHNTEHNSPNLSIAFDNLPGSFLSEMSPVDTVNGLDSMRISMYGNIIFVPTSSALGSDDYYRDFVNNPIRPIIDTPFHSFVLSNDADHHATEFKNYEAWLNEQLSMSLVGPQGIVLTGDSFSISGVPSGYSSPTWTSSNSCVTVNNGSITVNSLGVTTISVSTDDGVGGFHHKHRKVLSGFPGINLSAVKQNGSSYVVTATCTSLNNNLRSFVDELASQGNLRFIWGYKNSDNSYTWTDTTSTRSFVCTALPNTLTHICMKLYNAPGRESTTISSIDIDRRGDNPFFAEPTVLTVSALGNLLNYNHLSMTTASSHQYYGVWYNSDYAPLPSAPDNIRIGNETFNLITSFSKSIYGETKTVYCFPFMQSTSIQNAIDEINSGSGLNACFIPIQIRQGTTVLQNNWFYVEKMALLL